MSKFINVKNGKEVKVGDLVKVAYRVNHPVFGEMKAIKAITLTKDMLTKLIVKGEVKVVEPKIEYYKVWANAWRSLRIKTGVSHKEMLSILATIERANPWAAVQLLLKEIAIELDTKYDNHINDSEKIYAISPQDGRIHEINKIYIKNYKAFPAFRNIEDAKIAYSLIRRRLKLIFEDAKNK